jgi:hypothetical protein
VVSSHILLRKPRSTWRNPDPTLTLQYSNNLPDLREPTKPFILPWSATGYGVLGFVPCGLVGQTMEMEVQMVHGVEGRNMKA